MVGPDDDIFGADDIDVKNPKESDADKAKPKSYFDHYPSTEVEATKPNETKSKEEKQEIIEEEEEEEEGDEQEKKVIEPMEEDYYGTLDGEDEDSDEDLTKMDQGRGRSRLRPWDFETEEQWEKYNRQKEANPKAAFQFGIKMKDGRKNKVAKYRTPEEAIKAKERRQEQVFNKQWQQIQQLMKKKEGGKVVSIGGGTIASAERVAKRQKILRGFAK